MKRTKKAASALQPRARPGPEPAQRHGHSPDADAIRQAIEKLQLRIEVISQHFQDVPESLGFRDALETAVWALNEQLTSGGGRT